MDVPNVNWRFSSKFENMQEINFKTDVVNVGSHSLHKLHNTFMGGECSLEYVLELMNKSLETQR